MRSAKPPSHTNFGTSTAFHINKIIRQQVLEILMLFGHQTEAAAGLSKLQHRQELWNILQTRHEFVPIQAMSKELEYVLARFGDSPIAEANMQKLWPHTPPNAFEKNTAGISFGLIKEDVLRIEAYGNYRNMPGVDHVMIMIVVLATQ